jgi:hypothetical protein
VSLTYQWFVGQREIPAATHPTLKLVSQWVGRTASVRITASKPGYGTALANSKPTKPITKP